MFTGIVEELGSVRDCRRDGDGFALSIDCSTVLEGTILGDSIAVNGVCLTVTQIDGEGFVTGLAPETRKRTNLEALISGSPVNLERSVTPSTRMGGHFVQGHVDGTGTIKSFRRDEDALWVAISAPESVMRYVVVKGYITLDGTSLTVVDVGEDWFSVTLVAYTQSHIVMPTKNVGDAINIEVDVLGKYVERILQYGKTEQENATSKITPEFLQEAVTPNTHDSMVKEPLINEIGRSQLPTNYGQFDIIVYRDQQGFEHSALVKGTVSGTTPLIRLHSECLTGDGFGSLRCDCGPQLHTAMERIEEQGSGIILYMRQEGRGIGLGNKIRAYALQDVGRDTVDANHELGFPADARNYDVAAAMLTALDVNSVTLLSNNPAKREALQELGIDVVARVPLVIDPQMHNQHYLQTKAERMGHNYQSDDTGKSKAGS